MHRIAPLTEDRVDEVARVLAASFAVGSHASAMLPAKATGREEEWLRPFYAHLVRSAHLEGGASEVVLDDDGAVRAVALWNAPGQRRPALWREFLSAPLYVKVFGRHVFEALRSARQTGRERMREAPDSRHWYLRSLGTDPSAQGHGYGSELLQHRVEQADAEGSGIWLEASSRRNVPFYERFGFREQRELTAAGAAGLVTMWRAPGARH